MAQPQRWIAAGRSGLDDVRSWLAAVDVSKSVDAGQVAHGQGLARPARHRGVAGKLRPF